MSSLGSVDLLRVNAAAVSADYRRFVRRLIQEAPNVSLNGSEVRRFAIPELDDLDRWMVVEFDARGATYRVSGQLLSPDLLSPDDCSISFLGRIAFSSANFDNAPLDTAQAREAFGLMQPLLEALALRVGAAEGLGGAMV